jgi:hypothetical protein
VIQSSYHVLETEVLLLKKTTTKDLAEKLRSQYIKNPPEGMSDHDIKLMSDNDLLDMDYFLHEFDDDDDFGEEGFYLF